MAATLSTTRGSISSVIIRISVSRSFKEDGERRSYLSASCPVPKNFTAGFLSFARATYTFEGGHQITTESVRSCRAS